MHHDIDHLFDTLDGLGLAALVRAGAVTPLELLETALTRLARVSQLNAVAELLPTQARAGLQGQPTSSGLFAGVPTLIKDLFTPIRGARMANGSLAMGETYLTFDSEVVVRLREAGCVLAGTTTSPEFGTSYTTESSRFGATANPWHPAHSAGGSSGGAAALVAARAVPFAHGNDGGGSLRVPASCCGVFGFKPSRGRMPSGPVVGEGWAGMGTPHAITRSVRDSAALLDVTAGADVGAPYAAPAQSGTFLSAVTRDPRRLRIGLVEHLAPWPSQPDALAAVRQAATLCTDLGHEVIPATLPVDLPVVLSQIFDIIGASTREYLDYLAAMRGAPIREEELEPRTRIILRERGGVSGARYVAAVNGIHALGRVFATQLADYDVILTPTLTREPPRLGTLDAFDDTLTLEQVIAQFHSYSPFTALFNATGQPAMSVPLYWTPGGLPLGAHFAAGFGEEALLFSLAGQLERAQPWAGRVPLIHAGAAA